MILFDIQTFSFLKKTKEKYSIEIYTESSTLIEIYSKT